MNTTINNRMNTSNIFGGETLTIYDRLRLMFAAFRQLFIEGRKLFIEEIHASVRLLRLVFKRLKFHGSLTRQELEELNLRLKDTMRLLVIIAVFLLPGGLLLMPFVSGMLHRKH